MLMTCTFVRMLKPIKDVIFVKLNKNLETERLTA